MMTIAAEGNRIHGRSGLEWVIRKRQRGSKGGREEGRIFFLNDRLEMKQGIDGQSIGRMEHGMGN